MPGADPPLPVPRCLLVGALLAVPACATAEEPVELEEIVVSAPRVETRLSRVPGAVSVVNEAQIQRARQGLGLDESVARVPGVFLQNRYNFAQDLRISIRGAGARAPFGIRGVKILVDGIPATLPDGQSTVDALELESISRVEVLRGASSSLYGNASGGVVDITTDGPSLLPAVGVESALGSYGFLKNTAEAGGQFDDLGVAATLSRLDYDGFREHAETRSTKFNARIEYPLGADADVSLVARALDSPRARDPGALTASELAADRRQASPGNLRFDAGERVEEQQLGVVYRRGLGGSRELRLRAYSVWRDFANRLPFESGGQVAFDRRFNGAGILYRHDAALLGLNNRLLLGVDLDRQRDDRQRFDNLAGVRGRLVFDQLEAVTGIGAFMQSELRVTDRLTVTAGIRLDRLHFKVNDRFTEDGVDDSDSRVFRELSPKIGATWFVSRRLVPYVNVSRSFETPTTTELARCAGGGFVDDLEAQEAFTYEAGATGRLAGRLRYTAAVFHAEGKGEIASRACPGRPGREFFVNAGRTTRNGVELSLDVRLSRRWTTGVGYTFSDFEFDRFSTGGETFDDRTIPGVPRHRAYAEIEYRHEAGWFSALNALYTGDFFADNANTVTNDASLVIDARAGYNRDLGDWEIGVYAGVNNLFDEAYNTNVRINAFGDRYFEPAPGRNEYAGLQLGYRF